VLTVDTSAFNRTLANIADRLPRECARPLLMEEARLFVRDAIRATPPFARATYSESFNVQRRLGEGAVKRDIGGLFKTQDSLGFVKNPRNMKLAVDMLNAIKRRDAQAANAILKNVGVDMAAIASADPGVHQSARGRRGRVVSRRKYLVLDARSVAQFIKTKQSHVGRAKAGWVPAARALGLQLPGWITRHSTPGIYKPDYENASMPAVTVGNLISFGSDFSHLRIVQAALNNRVKSMQKRAEWTIKRFLQKYG
jgi:hypothetical protein